MAKRIVIPFADSGDRTVVNDDAQSDGLISYTQGYGPQYSLDIASDPAARRVNRDRNNQLWHDATSNIQEWQNQVYPDYITQASNGGTAASYGRGVTVNFNGTFRVSLVADNTELPSNNSNWSDAFPWPVALGGTGAIDAASARVNLGLGSASTANVDPNSGAGLLSRDEIDSRFAGQIDSSTMTEPLGNKNVYFRRSMVRSPDPTVSSFPPASGNGNNYTVGQEFVWGAWAGANSIFGVTITDNDGIAWTSQSLQLRYDIENTTTFTQGDETVYIIGQNGVAHYLKVADTAALSSTLVSNLLSVNVSSAIFSELGITSIRVMGLQDITGSFGEKSAEDVNDDLQGQILNETTPEDVLSSRVAGVTYTNNESYPLQVSVGISTATALRTLSVNSVVVSRVSITSGSISSTLSYIVMPGQTYIISSGPAPDTWTEGRL